MILEQVTFLTVIAGKCSWRKIFMFFVVEHWTTNILTTKEATLTTFTCSASSNHEMSWPTNIFTIFMILNKISLQSEEVGNDPRALALTMILVCTDWRQNLKATFLWLSGYFECKAFITRSPAIPSILTSYKCTECLLASFPGRVDSKNNTADRQLGLVLIVSGRVSGHG